MRAGRLRHTLTLEIMGQAADAVGADASFPIVAGDFPADIEPVSGSESVRGNQLQANVTHLVRMRYGCPVSANDRFRFGSRTFEVVYVLNVGERNRELQVQCIETT